MKDFLKLHWKPGRPILIGVSGGGDSLVLLHLLHRARRFFPLDLHVAHIDHGWRTTSGQEAQELQLQVEKLGLPFHLKRLEPPKEKKNLEDQARSARLSFFRHCYMHWNCQALLLGHHQDDQTETVIKRFFEGAGVFALGGLKEISVIEGMSIWRPLLKLPKKVLIQWLQKQHIDWVEDPTNSEEHLLRGRMRTLLIPQLIASFGKNFSAPVARLGETFHELSAYLHRRTAVYTQHLTQRGEERILDLKPLRPIEKWELRSFLQQQEIDLSSRQFEILHGLIEKKISGKKIIGKNCLIIISKDLLSIKKQLC